RPPAFPTRRSSDLYKQGIAKGETNDIRKFDLSLIFFSPLGMLPPQHLPTKPPASHIGSTCNFQLVGNGDQIFRITGEHNFFYRCRFERIHWHIVQTDIV